MPCTHHLEVRLVLRHLLDLVLHLGALDLLRGDLEGEPLDLGLLARLLLRLVRPLLLRARALRVVLLQKLVELDQRLLQLQILLLQHLLAPLERRLAPLELLLLRIERLLHLKHLPPLLQQAGRGGNMVQRQLLRQVPVSLGARLGHRSARCLWCVEGFCNVVSDKEGGALRGNHGSFALQSSIR